MEHKIIYVIEEARIYGMVVKSCSRSDILIPRLNVLATTMSHVFVIFFFLFLVHSYDFRECFIFFSHLSL